MRLPLNLELILTIDGQDYEYYGDEENERIILLKPDNTYKIYRPERNCFLMEIEEELTQAEVEYVGKGIEFMLDYLDEEDITEENLAKLKKMI